MRKILQLILISGLMMGSAFAETVYVDGKAVDKKVIDAAMEQIKKNPMAAQQLNKPEFKKEILYSIGMQQAILAEGNSQKLESSKEYQAKIAEIKPMIYAQILQEKAMNTGGPITDAQLKTKYDKMKAEDAKKINYKVSHILVKTESEANAILGQLKPVSGKSAEFNKKFAELAKSKSTDPGTKSNGGDLGWSDGSGFVPEFTAAIKKLGTEMTADKKNSKYNKSKVYYTTAAVKSQFGYHIVKLDDERKGTEFPKFDAQFKEQLRQEEQSIKVRSYFDGLKTKHKVEVK